MDFARKQLEKYGWKEGKGLGKNEDGITKPIKASLKFDNTGIGHDPGAEFSDKWWEALFNKVAQNISVEVENENVNISCKSDDFEISTGNYSKKKGDDNKFYGTFLKTSKLTSKGVENYHSISNVEEAPKKKFEMLTDEELFAACGGRTAHKGARHGLTLSGKLARLEKQEQMLLKKMKAYTLADDHNKMMKKMRKLKLHKETIENEDTNDSVEPFSDSSSSSIKKKKKKKSRKNVSFSDTVLEYQIPNPENFINPLVVRDNETSNSDEGIEKDIEDNNNQNDNHRSFEEPQFFVSDLSSVEKKKLKKKRKLEGKLKTASKFVMEGQDEDMEDISSTQECKKRKLNIADAKFSDCKRSQPEQEAPELLPNKHEKKKKHKKSNKEKYRNTEEQKLKNISLSLQNVCKISEED